MPRLREFRLAKSEQILPLIANRKPASDRTHWIRSNLRHARPGAGRAWRGTGRPAEFSPSGFHPVTGIAYRQEDRRVRLQNGGDSVTACRALHTLSGNSNFLVPPPLGVGVCGKLPAARKRKDRQRIGLADPSLLPPVPGTESPLEIWLGRSNRSRADLAGSWTTRVQARRVPADPTADRKPKACQ